MQELRRGQEGRYPAGQSGVCELVNGERLLRLEINVVKGLAERWVKGGVGVDGQEVREHSSDVRGSHGRSRKGSDGIGAALVGRLDVQARTEDINTFADIGKVSALITKSGGADGYGLLGGGGRVAAGILVVVT